MKRVSAIVGTTLALYLVMTSGIMQILMVAALCIGLALLLHRFFGDATPEASIVTH